MAIAPPWVGVGDLRPAQGLGKLKSDGLLGTMKTSCVFLNLPTSPGSAIQLQPGLAKNCLNPLVDITEIAVVEVVFIND